MQTERQTPETTGYGGMSNHFAPQIFTKTMLAIAVLGLAFSVRAGEFPNGVKDTLGPRFNPDSSFKNLQIRQSPPSGTDCTGRIRYWNEIAINASGLDHTPVAPGENRVFGEQLGPCRASRAMAIVHIAIFDAVNAIVGGYESYTGLSPAPKGTSMDAAVAQAAHDTLIAMFPSQTPRFDQYLTNDLAKIPTGDARKKGINLGKQAAAAILALRADDGSQHAEPRVGIEFITGNLPGQWQQDPISMSPLALGAYWGEVTPFVLASSDQFRIQPPPALDSAEFLNAFDEVKRLGGDGVVTPTERTPEQTFIGVFWAYDGTPSLCAPPRLYNQIAVHIAKQKGTDAVRLARLLALLNVAMADTGIASWESKFYFQFWRPVTGVRGLDDPNFTPLGAPASNLTGPNFTPPFPSCPSGHACFGGALFHTLRLFYGTDRIPFTFVSDEFNGVTRDNQGNVRPLIPRSFSRLSQAEEENGQSRIYLGIHWGFDKSEGIEQGRQVAGYVFNNVFLPVRHDCKGR